MPTEQTQPSPRPWRVEHKPARPGSPIPAAIYAANGERLTPVAINADANFDLIVRAVNSFDALVSALRQLEHVALSPHGRGSDDALRAARAALALAEERT